MALAANGCSRAKYRREADREAHDVIAERNADPRWSTNDYSIEVDPRSRYFDVYDPDHPPMPPDDPDSHQYMHQVDGMPGWEHWHENGVRNELENPAWREALAEYVEIGVDGAVQLDVESALKLAYVHSPSHQRQLETLYLSALDVTTERFRLDTQFFGGYDTKYAHNGSLNPAGLGFSPLLRRFVVTPAVDGVETNRLTLGRPFGGNPALQARRRFASAGELLVGFANSFVFEFTGSDANLAASLANFSFVQPLLRGAGRDIALEQLTLDERKLLADLRAYSQYRQGFYTQIAIGENGVTGTQRSNGGTNLRSSSGQGGFDGYLGLLEQAQQIRNTKDNLSLQIRTRTRLEALLANDLIDLVQVDEFRQSVQAVAANLLVRENSHQLSLDRYKTGTLGLPPDLAIDLDDSVIRQFQLVPREATAILDSIIALQSRVGQLPDVPEVEAIDQAIGDALLLVEPVRQLLARAVDDLARMDEVMPTRYESMTDDDKETFENDRGKLRKNFADLQQKFETSAAELENLRVWLSEETRQTTARRLVSWVSAFLQTVDRSALVPARARLETITVDSLELESDDALQIALENRLDFMNGRAALVDSWRAIQINADALKSVLNITSSGDIRTARNNAASFRAPTGSLRLGLEFDAPFSRLQERNAYRESLIEYQRSRRRFIQSRDSLHLGLRALIRRIEQLRKSLEIERRAVAIALRRVDQTQLALTQPSPPPQPGQRPPINPTTAKNLLSAQTSFRATQNNFLNVWLNHYAARMRLYRELGIMMLDAQGRWMPHPIGGEVEIIPEIDDAPNVRELPLLPPAPLPPVIPTGWIDPEEILEVDPVPVGTAGPADSTDALLLRPIDEPPESKPDIDPAPDAELAPVVEAAEAVEPDTEAEVQEDAQAEEGAETETEPRTPDQYLSLEAD